jgi:hypothetical protein
MEIACPECGQPLRVPDGLRFARVRCRACQNIFETSTEKSDLSSFNSSFSGRSRYEPDDYDPETKPYDSGSTAPQLGENFDSEQPVSPDPPQPENKRWKARFAGAFLIFIALITRGPQLMKLFKPKRQPPRPAVRPVNEAKDPDRKLGEELRPPKRRVTDRIRRLERPLPAVVPQKQTDAKQPAVADGQTAPVEPTAPIEKSE